MPSGGRETRLRRRRRLNIRKKLAVINSKRLEKGEMPFKTLTQYRKNRRANPNTVAAPVAG